MAVRMRASRGTHGEPGRRERWPRRPPGDMLLAPAGGGIMVRPRAPRPR